MEEGRHSLPFVLMGENFPQKSPKAILTYTSLVSTGSHICLTSHWKCSYKLYWFSKAIAVAPPLGSTASPATGRWLRLQCQAWIPSYCQSWSLIRRWLVTPRVPLSHSSDYSATLPIAVVCSCWLLFSPRSFRGLFGYDET